MSSRTDLVAVAMSGGVDSTAAALRLCEAGHSLVGVTALLPHAAGAQAAERAAAVCSQLGVPHHVVDLREEFERLVIEPFVAEYARGRTPNPCVRCNERIKFGLLLDEALRLGADRLATGHYARTTQDDGRDVCLLRAVSLQKDQSYVLHHLAQEQLRRALFVNGESTRREVEGIVAAAGLAIQPGRESQDICFLQGARYDQLLRERIPEAFVPGEIVDTEGRALGQHAGLVGYTIGQRKGLGIGGPGGRKFVLHIDTQRNRLVVGEDAALWVSWCEVEDTNLIGREARRSALESATEVPLHCDVMVRYNGALTPAKVTISDGAGRVELARPARAPAPGQSAVFYQGELCLGGGVISRTALTEMET